MSIEPIETAAIHHKADIIETLQDIDNQTLAEWWCWLNGSESGNRCHWHQHVQIMNVIQDTIGHKACNREWNKDRMTDDEHEKWYRENYKTGEIS